MSASCFPMSSFMIGCFTFEGEIRHGKKLFRSLHHRGLRLRRIRHRRQTPPVPPRTPPQPRILVSNSCVPYRGVAATLFSLCSISFGIPIIHDHPPCCPSAGFLRVRKSVVLSPQCFQGLSNGIGELRRLWSSHKAVHLLHHPGPVQSLDFFPVVFPQHDERSHRTGGQ